MAVTRRRDIPQRIGGRREVAHRVIAEARHVRQRIGDAGRLAGRVVLDDRLLILRIRDRGRPSRIVIAKRRHIGRREGIRDRGEAVIGRFIGERRGVVLRIFNGRHVPHAVVRKLRPTGERIHHGGELAEVVVGVVGLAAIRRVCG